MSYFNINRKLLKRCIEKRAKELNIIIEKDIDELLNKYENMGNGKNISIQFLMLKETFTRELLASLNWNENIVLNPEWAIQLVLDNENAENAFLITLGHEITHNEGDFTDIHAYFRNKKFINWVNEVHADFGGAEKMGSSNRNKLIASIVYKRSFKKKRKWNKDYSTHPSWNKREEYVTNYNFDEILIKKIATEAGCMNQTLIDKVIDYYKPIILE